ncbi:hypothetical protein ACWDUL_20765 [Nocardia niigatensis]
MLFVMVAEPHGTQQAIAHLCAWLEVEIAPEGSASERDSEQPKRRIEVLTELLQHARNVDRIWTLDPSLCDEVDGTSRLAPVNVFHSLARRILREVDLYPPRPIAPGTLRFLWDDVDALLARSANLSAEIVRTLPRHLGNREDSQQTSLDRLETFSDTVLEAALLLEAAVREALRVPDPHPNAKKLARIAHELKGLGRELDERFVGPQNRPQGRALHVVENRRAAQ